MIAESFLDHFEDFPDHRINRKKLYIVQEILLVALCGTILGCEDLEEYGFEYASKNQAKKAVHQTTAQISWME